MQMDCIWEDSIEREKTVIRVFKIEINVEREERD